MDKNRSDADESKTAGIIPAVFLRCSLQLFACSDLRRATGDAAIENGVRKVMYVSTKEAFLKAVDVTYSNRKNLYGPG
ncbi:hypothetical protein PDENDC454_09105 [Paenibacillus dendritiformis C454]|uniref:Uncharacterized protein n=1 Tax=Paenibacillus dendritiformis C454 TaxID=1131935 RepID=H3SE70_9BACL|nr:hypothetical protein PDENDC454_09105 [Paenibacillus dendritiformis C454]